LPVTTDLHGSAEGSLTPKGCRVPSSVIVPVRIDQAPQVHQRPTPFRTDTLRGPFVLDAEIHRAAASPYPTVDAVQFSAIRRSAVAR
jgi:hypothetical protein